MVHTRISGAKSALTRALGNFFQYLSPHPQDELTPFGIGSRNRQGCRAKSNQRSPAREDSTKLFPQTSKFEARRRQCIASSPRSPPATYPMRTSAIWGQRSLHAVPFSSRACCSCPVRHGSIAVQPRRQDLGCTIHTSATPTRQLYYSSIFFDQ
ncbi:hypothetical protein SEVIR_5G387550v4 [Setaria viridis]